MAGGPPRAMPRRADRVPPGPKTRCCAAPLLYNSACFNRSQPEPPPCPSPSTSRRSPPR
ncbi:acetylglutamate kinase [Burkholderia cenocepacia]|nr:acetylglutamate kinase [Burkholderia sp. AU17457]OXI70193.1 acetylglutamate kinase [Burkholderia sp. AU28863]RQU13131.1 acetylglutamate kinase [Burkholderia cenocepacia]RQU23443.1 acetylglutamate kinase [Burkholderia cenocepacia]